MHIGILSDPANFHTKKWACALQKAGAKVTVFSFSQDWIQGVPCVSIEPKSTINGQLTYRSYLAGGPDLFEELVRHKIDLINPINVTPFSVWGMRSGFRPMVSIAMGADILEYPSRFSELEIDPERIWNSNATKMGLLSKVQYRFKWSVFRKYIKQALEASDLITGDNLELVYAVRNWFDIPDERVKLNRWGVEPATFTTDEAKRSALRKKYGVRDWQKVVLSPRGMKPVYQGDVILDAFERLVRRGVRDLKLIMLSAGYDIPPEVDAKAIALAEQFENFHYERSLLPRQEVIDLWSIVDSFVVAPVYDGYSNALAEGRYAGAIPIVNDISAHRELLAHQKNAWMVDPFTPEHLADGIIKVMEEYEHWQGEFAPLNRAWIEAHSLLDENITSFLADCESVLRSKKVRQKRY